jgi:outer membrane receptor protein involved in Fe transport
LEWVPVRGLTARAAYSTSFRAPLFFEQAFPLSGLLFDLPDPLSVRPDGLTTTILLNGGNPGLEPEKGRSWTAGLELQPPAIPKLRARLNYFDVEYRGQIQELINRFSIDALQNGAALAQFITRNPDDPAVTALVNSIPDGVLDLVNTFAFITDPATLLAQNTIGAIYAGQYQNAGVTTVRGLDFDIQYSQALGNGTLNLGLNGTNLLEYDLAATAGSPGVDLLNIAFNPVDLRFRASATWTQGAWAASTFVNYVDAYRDRGSAFTTGGAIPSWTTVDFQIRYGSSNSSGWLGDGAIALSFTNLFNIDPPKLNALPLQLPFDAENANPLGRLISLTVTKNW